MKTPESTSRFYCHKVPFEEWRKRTFREHRQLPHMLSSARVDRLCRGHPFAMATTSFRVSAPLMMFPLSFRVNRLRHNKRRKT